MARQDDGYTFVLGDEVTRTPVLYKNRKRLVDLGKQRWADVDTGERALTPTFPAEIPADGLDPITSEFFEYYVADRGHHPRSIDQTTDFSELVVVPGARHIDLYDRIGLIPFDALETFFLAQLDATKES